MKAFNEVDYIQNLKELETYGYTVVSSLLDEDEVRSYKASIDELYEKTSKKKYSGVPDRDDEDKIIYNLQNKDKRFIDLIFNEWNKKFYKDKLNDPYHRFLDSDQVNANLLYFNARSSGKALDLHIDSYVPYRGDHTIVMQYTVFLDDSNEDNGCTVVVPGSHQSGNFTDRELKNVKPLCAKAGDLVIWDSRLWHGTMANTIAKSRWALIATVGMWWIKPSMNIPASLPQEIYEQLSDEQKAFMGFCSLPPNDESERINTKCGYDFLKENVKDYFS